MVWRLRGDRRSIPTAWRLLLGECRAGLRRYAGTERGEAYQKILAHGGEGDYAEPSIYERTLGDLLSPVRPGRMVDCVNAVTRETGVDAADWRVSRMLSMLAGIEQSGPEPDI